MPKGAFYSIVKLPVDDAEKFAQWLLEEFDYNGQTVMLEYDVRRRTPILEAALHPPG